MGVGIMPVPLGTASPQAKKLHFLVAHPLNGRPLLGPSLLTVFCTLGTPQAQGGPEAGAGGGSSAHWKYVHCSPWGLAHLKKKRPCVGPSLRTCNGLLGSPQRHAGAGPSGAGPAPMGGPWVAWGCKGQSRDQWPDWPHLKHSPAGAPPPPMGTPEQPPGPAAFGQSRAQWPPPPHLKQSPAGGADPNWPFCGAAWKSCARAPPCGAGAPP